MPFQIGSVAVHDDGQHFGSSKRDVLDGVAGLDGSGFVLAKGAGIQFPRNASNDVHIYERTSGEEAYAFHRTGANDYTFYIKEGNVWKRFQTESMKDVNNGIAALNATGCVLAAGNCILMVRDWLDQIIIGERTSGEFPGYWHRTGVDDYEMYVKTGGSARRVQSEDMKDVASGIAGLDANIQLDLLQMRICRAEYSNHLGVTDAFTDTATGGNGTATPDATNHEMDLISGITVVGHASFRTIPDFRFDSKYIICNILVRNISTGAGGNRFIKAGFAVDWTGVTANDTAIFQYDSAVGWQTVTKTASGVETHNISNILSGDILAVIATTTSVKFYVNNILVSTHTTYISSAAMELGVACGSYTTAAATSAAISVDYLGLQQIG